MSSPQLSTISEEEVEDAITDQVMSMLAANPLPPRAPTPASPCTPGSRDKKGKRIFKALKKHSSGFIDSFKRHESQLEGRRSSSSASSRSYFGPPGTIEERRNQNAADRNRERMERGPIWWERITRAEQRKIAYKDSIESLVLALERAEGRWRDQEEKDLYFRCDIHAKNRVEFPKIEKECKQLVVAAGGKVHEEHEDIGGFLYSLPNNNSTIDPLAKSDGTHYTGHISMPFRAPPPQVDNATPEAKEFGVLGASPKNSDDWPLLSSPTSKSKMKAWVDEQRIKAEKAAEEGERVRQALADDEVVLSPRILDAGVELAIMDPGRLMMSASQMRMSMPSASSVMEVATEDEEVAVLRRAETAVRAQPRLVTITRTFGQEMRQVEELYRDWVPNMSRARGA